MYLWGLETKIVKREVGIINKNYFCFCFFDVKMRFENVATKMYFFVDSFEVFWNFGCERVWGSDAGLSLRISVHTWFRFSSYLVSYLLLLSPSLGLQHTFDQLQIIVAQAPPERKQQKEWFLILTVWKLSGGFLQRRLLDRNPRISDLGGLGGKLSMCIFKFLYDTDALSPGTMIWVPLS